MGLDRPRAAFHVLLKSKGFPVEVVPLTRTRADEMEMLAIVTTVLCTVEVGTFHRVRGWACQDCPWRYRCDG